MLCSQPLVFLMYGSDLVATSLKSAVRGETSGANLTAIDSIDEDCLGYSPVFTFHRQLF